MKTNLRTLLALGSCLLGFVITASASEGVRLSRTLIPAEYEDSGLKQLTSDQVAILDALVRRDTANQLRPNSSEPQPERFSERLTADERKSAGLSLLSENQLAKLDNYVARLSAPLGSASGSFSYQAGRTGPYVAARTLKRAPEIHGMISLMYGQGSDGYSERGGAMMITYDDPSGFSLAVGYSEIKTEGGSYYRDYRDRYYDSFDVPRSSYRDRVPYMTSTENALPLGLEKPFSSLRGR